MNKKKILIVTNFYYPNFSGIIDYINVLSNSLIDKNFRIYILTARTNNKQKRIEKSNNMIIIRSNVTFNLSRGYFSFSLIRDFIFISKKVDLINFHFPLVEILPLLFLTTKRKILTIHCMPPLVKNNILSLFVKIYFSISCFFSIFFTNKTIVTSIDYFKQYYHYLFFKKKIHEIHPSTNFLKIDSNKNIITKNNDKIIIGFLGRICEEKGIENIILSSKLLFKNDINHEIHIAGNLEDKRFEKYINKIKLLSQDMDSIKLLGEINDKEKSEFYNKIHVLLLPSVNAYEAFGIVQLEAMSYGKLVVSSNLKGVRLPVMLTGNGAIINNISIEEITNKIIYCSNLARERTINEVIDNAYKIFNKDIFLSKHLNIFNI